MGGTGNSLAVQWLGLRAVTAQVQSLVTEPGSRKPRGEAKKREKIFKKTKEMGGG